jgi:hypothetical protein
VRKASPTPWFGGHCDDRLTGRIEAPEDDYAKRLTVGRKSSGDADVQSLITFSALDAGEVRDGVGVRCAGPPGPRVAHLNAASGLSAMPRNIRWFGSDGRHELA